MSTIILKKNAPAFEQVRDEKQAKPTGEIYRPGTKVEIEGAGIYRVGHGARADDYVMLKVKAASHRGRLLMAEHLDDGVECHTIELQATRVLHLKHTHDTKPETLSHALDKLASSLRVSRSLFETNEFNPFLQRSA